MEWLDKIGQPGPGAGLDECFYRHFGQKLEAVQAFNFLHRCSDMDEIISRAALLILDDIAGDPDYGPLDLR